MYYCIAWLKTGGKTEDILAELLKTFKADEAVFLSANDNYEGVNLADSFALCRDRSFLTQYANYYWRYDPLYKMQFSHTSANPVFKTDDVISYSKMVKLEYYYSFLRPQNLLGEMIVRLNTKNELLGVISLQRYQERQGFEKRDVLKASLLVPYLVSVFETARAFSKIDNERSLMEQWMEYHSDGIILMDSEYKPIYINSQARLFCLLMNEASERKSFNVKDVEITIPQVIVQDCQNLNGVNASVTSLQRHSNRIFDIKQKKRYYTQYFPIILRSSEVYSPHFVVFISELTRYNENSEDILTAPRKLSKREEVITQCVALGLTNKQIADRLCISPFTVQNHLKSIFEKTGLDSRTKLANLVKFSESYSV
jgi:DNA-binding CsgD family transcriptional regulator